MRDLEGKTAVVTGGASGMGRGFADVFAGVGMNVVMADIEEKALRKAAAEVEALGVSVLPVVTDVSDEAAMDHLASATQDAFGTAHVVCLNAGVSVAGGPIETMTTKDWKWTLDVNLWGVIHGVRVFVPMLKAQDEGHVVVTASVAGLTSFPWLGPYNASKHAAVTIAETLYAELRAAESKVGVSCLCPGAVTTQIGQADRNRPKELANKDQEGGDGSDASLIGGDAGDLSEFVEIFEKISQAPSAVAERVLEAVVEDRFWIETDEFYRNEIHRRHQAIESKTAPATSGLILQPYLEGR